MPPHTLTSLEIQCYYQNKPGFNRVYSWDNLPNKTIDGAYAMNTLILEVIGLLCIH